MKLNINISNKVFYTFVAVAVIVLGVILVTAIDNREIPNSKAWHFLQDIARNKLSDDKYYSVDGNNNGIIDEADNANCEVIYEGDTGTKVTVSNRCLDNKCFLFFEVEDSGDARFSTYPTSQWGAGDYFQLDTVAGTPAFWSFGPGFNVASEIKGGKNAETPEIIMTLSTLLNGGDASTRPNKIYLYDDYGPDAAGIHELGIKEWFIYEEMINGKTGKAKVKLTAC